MCWTVTKSVNLKRLEMSKYRKNKSGKKSFTLIELLLVIAVIGILLSLLLPSLSRARRTAKVAVCMSNQAQIGRAMSHYDKIYYRYPASTPEISGGAIAAVYRPGNKKWMNHGLLFSTELISADIFYCDLFTREYWQYGEFHPTQDNHAGIPKPGQVFPRQMNYWKTAYIYRAWLPEESGTMTPMNPRFADSNTPVLGDYFTRDMYEYSHEGIDYNILFTGGNVKHFRDKSQSIGTTSPYRGNHSQLGNTFWDRYFKK